MWETIKNGKSWKGLFQNKKKEGSLYWEKVNITPIQDNTGKIVNYLAVKDDVTDELKVKEELKSFALFAKHNPDPVMRFNSYLTVIEANPAAVAILKTEQVIGKNAASLIPELIDTNVDALIENNEQKSIRIQVDENYFNLVIKGIKALNLVHVYGSNITEQVKAEKVIESMALFARLNPEPVFRINNAFKVVDANPAATKTFKGISKEADIRDIVPAFSELPIAAFINENKIQNRQEHINDRVYRMMLRGESSSNICLVYSADITERYQQEQKIKKQAEKIQSSIQYASNIQAAVLPSLNYVNQILPNSMILNLPRDVVSGDFYWIKKVDDSIVIAIADCTGHGVPGAFMSMLGVAFLNEIVKPGNLKADEILNRLRQYVISTLSNSDDSRADGMDMALCIIQPKNKTLQYAGANNPFVLINNNGMQVIKADRMPIGTYVKQDKPFTLHEIPYQTGDVVYLFSDGYQDQLGGNNLLKFGSKKFRELLLKIQNDDFGAQKQVLETKLEEWIQNYHRIDDVLVMGFKLD
jgi:serine phosphatase RsbU (regulator of sigma subunit)